MNKTNKVRRYSTNILVNKWKKEKKQLFILARNKKHAQIIIDKANEKLESLGEKNKILIVECNRSSYISSYTDDQLDYQIELLVMKWKIKEFDILSIKEISDFKKKGDEENE